MLKYKCENVWYEEVNEAYTTQTCSLSLSCIIPVVKGRKGLGIREWQCMGTVLIIGL